MKKILQMKISLNEIEPKIWRRFLVSSTINFEDLHNIIQIVMGWANYHLWEFKIGKNTITLPDEEGFNQAEGVMKKIIKSPDFQKILEQQNLKKDSSILDVTKLNKILDKQKNKKSGPMYNKNTKISELIKSKGQKASYCYDFGDNWEHEIIVENILEDEGNKKIPRCLDGKKACPPEDCGSISGYYELMEIRKNKKHPEYKEMIVEWLGEDYDPEYFNIDEINKELKKRV